MLENFLIGLRFVSGIFTEKGKNSPCNLRKRNLDESSRSTTQLTKKKNYIYDDEVTVRKT